MERFTVKQLGDLAKVSIRTLHHYDEIGLLKPSYVGQNGYRYYERTEALRLQQILLYRDLGVSLNDIRLVLDAPDFDVAAALKSHRNLVLHKISEFQQQLMVLDNTISALSGRQNMAIESLYAWPSAAKQEDYEQWLIERYGNDMNEHINLSQKIFARLDSGEKTKVMKQLETIEADLVLAFKSGIDSEATALEPVLEAHRHWIAFMWGRDCPKVAYGSLSDMYLSHPDFVSRYEALAEGFCAYLTAAMKAYAAR